MRRRDFFKSIFGAAGCLAMLPAKAHAQVLHPPHGKRKGILTIPERLSMKNIRELQTQWNAAVASDKPIVLTGGIKYEEFDVSEETEIRQTHRD
jgi:hypothetical protein